MNNYFAVQAYNNAWSNHRLGKACAALSSEELAETRTGFFPSIIATLNHILIVDWFYVSALEGQCMGTKAFERDVPCPDIAALNIEQRKIDQRFVAVCRDPHKAVASRTVDMIRGEVVQTERFDRTCLHLLQHQIHHRGQVHAMLSGTSVPPPQLDEFFSNWDADRQLRAGDLQEMGLCEEDIWKGY